MHATRRHARVFASRALLAAVVGFFGVAAGADPAVDGRELMVRVDERPRGHDQLLLATWKLVHESGRERVRRTRSYWIDLRGLEGSLRSKRLIVFDAPTQLEDTAFLVWSDGRFDTDDRRWVYLPALRKTRRVGGRDRGKSFAGTDFYYEDLSDLHVDEERHVLEGRSEDDAFWKVVSSPVDEASPYSKRVRWVHPEHYTTHRVEFYDRRDVLLKTLEIRWQQDDGVWTWERLEMRNHRSGHATIVEVNAVRHGLGFEETLFSQHELRAGPPQHRIAAREPSPPADETLDTPEVPAHPMDESPEPDTR